MIVSKPELTLGEFIREVPAYHAEYLKNNPCVPKIEAIIQRRMNDPVLKETSCSEKHLKVEELITQRIKDLSETQDRGYLEKGDIEIVVRWGSRKMGSRLWTRINNKEDAAESIRRHTKEAIEALPDADTALRHIMNIHGLGVSFGSKVVAFLYPDSSPVLDRVINDCLSKADNWTGRYDDFIALCRHTADQQKEPNWHRADGRWCLRDVEMAMFQFAYREKGKPTTYIVKELSFRQ